MSPDGPAQIGRAEALPASGETADTARQGALAQTHSCDHAVNVRLSMPSPFGRFYLLVIGGRERRSVTRRSEERRRHPLVTAGNLLFFLACGVVAGLTTLGLLQILGRYVFVQAGLASF